MKVVPCLCELFDYLCFHKGKKYLLLSCTIFENNFDQLKMHTWTGKVPIATWRDKQMYLNQNIMNQKKYWTPNQGQCDKLRLQYLKEYMDVLVKRDLKVSLKTYMCNQIKVELEKLVILVVHVFVILINF